MEMRIRKHRTHMAEPVQLVVLVLGFLLPLVALSLGFGGYRRKS